MPRANATIDPTVTTTEVAQFQSTPHAVQNGLDSGGRISSPGDGQPAKAIRFSVTSGSTASLRVRIPGLHNPNQYAFIAAGETIEFVNITKDFAGAIHVVYVSTASGTATYNYAVIA